MNARQKAKKLKKELEELKADRTGGFKWLKIDNIVEKELDPYYWNSINNHLMFRAIPTTYEIQIGAMRATFTPAITNDTLVVIDSSKLDQAYIDALERRKEQNRKAYEYTKKLERVKENERETEGEEIQKDS